VEVAPCRRLAPFSNRSVLAVGSATARRTGWPCPRQIPRNNPRSTHSIPGNFQRFKPSDLSTMQVLFLTMFLSTMLGSLFAWLFLRDWRKHPFASAERASLLPLDEEIPVPARKAARTPPQA